MATFLTEQLATLFSNPSLPASLSPSFTPSILSPPPLSPFLTGLQHPLSSLLELHDLHSPSTAPPPLSSRCGSSPTLEPCYIPRRPGSGTSLTCVCGTKLPIPRWAWLSKADVVSAFKILPLHPDSWRLFRVRFSVHLAFGCKVTPSFDSFAKALCWICLTRPQFVLYLLGNFVIGPPSSPLSMGLEAMTSAFTHLRAPPSENSVGPSTSLEFLGIFLDSASFQVSPPVPSTVFPPSATLFTTQNRTQGRSFISRLLLLAFSSEPSTIRYAQLILHVRAPFLAVPPLQSNGFFFYANAASSSFDIKLFTDAAPSSGRFCLAGELHLLRRAILLRSLDLYAVLVAALLWGHEWSKSILLHSDQSRRSPHQKKKKKIAPNR
ncbi:uncharacterized protein LOC125785634 isoform X1 [Astyanax mexicanus]|uniref:uncharacterized protein LOC125785634 isoform X1 n=1 Tax=Astyanax mexicanus TaxID=7994 RepID=UPI0020CB09C3|nr:uncharacterized protein LOC125785634 isoform X1 [Astyanax mexicanus]